MQGDRAEVKGRCWEGQVLCFAVASRFVCLWSVKSCSDGCPPRLGCTHRKSWLPGLPLLCSGERKSGLAWAAGARWLQVMRFSYFFFCLFFFLFHFVEIFTAIGEEERSKRTP